MQGVYDDRRGDHTDNFHVMAAIKLGRNLLVEPGFSESTRISAHAVNQID